MNADQRSQGSIEIRRADPADLPRIAELARVTWRASFPSIITTEQIEYMLAQRYSPEAMTEATATGRLCFELLLHNGELVAFAAHGPISGSTDFKLQQLYVHPAWQGHGFGGMLLDHIEKLARESGRAVIVLTVNRRNHRARAVYERHGYQIRSEAQIDIGNGFIMDDFIMEKRVV